MAAQAGKKGRAKRLVIAGLILAALAAAGVFVAGTAYAAAPAPRPRLRPPLQGGIPWRN